MYSQGEWTFYQINDLLLSRLISFCGPGGVKEELLLLPEMLGGHGNNELLLNSNFIFFISENPPNSLTEWVLLYSLYTWGHTGLERFGNFPGCWVCSEVSDVSPDQHHLKGCAFNPFSSPHVVSEECSLKADLISRAIYPLACPESEDLLEELLLLQTFLTNAWTGR